MVKYVLTSTMFEGEIVFIYAANGFIVEYANTAIMSEAQIEFLYKHFPFHVSNCTILASKSKSLHLREVPIELTFDMFWDKMNYKVDKNDALKNWKKLSKKEQLEAYEYIPSYYSEIARTGAAKKYPKTYLSSKPWVK